MIKKGDRVLLCFRPIYAEVISPHGTRLPSGDKEWVVQIEGSEGFDVAGESEMFLPAKDVDND